VLVTETAPVQRLCRTGWLVLVSGPALGPVSGQALGQALVLVSVRVSEQVLGPALGRVLGLVLVLVSVPELEQALVPASEQELCRTGPLPSRTRRAEQAHKCGRPLC